MSPKNCYANSRNFQVCIFTSMGCWLSLIRDHFKNKDSIFIRAGNSYSGTKTYGLQLKEMLKPYHREIMSMGSSHERTKPHGFCKGSGTHATSGTTAGPSLPSVALRGEWSQGTVFNIYLQFASAGKLNLN